MKFNVEKCVQIVNDLILFFHSAGADSYHLDLTPGKDKVRFQLQIKIDTLSKEDINYLSHSIIQPRQYEMETTYWAISYDSAGPAELATLGMMLDEVKIDYDGSTLTLSASR